MDKIQKLYNYCIEQVEEATAKERIDHAQGNMGSWETGKQLAYADIARRLVNMGARLIVESEE